jgi:Transketolase, thiamine diphosphate binding domain
MHSVEMDLPLGGSYGIVQKKDAPVVVVNGVGVKHSKLPTHGGWRQNLDDDDRAVMALRNLICDICNHNGGGHAGSAIGMSAIGVALFKHTMRYNPSDSEWFDRDRFVLSNGKQ